MKTLVITLVMATSLLVNAQDMEDSINIQETISKMFVNSDAGNWPEVEAQFAPTVTLDYSSMTGNPATKVSPKDITTGWKTVLPGFTKTHHQIGNFITEVTDNKAHSFCYGTATHYLEDANGSVWTVIGSYDFDLEKLEGNWKITAMTFNYKYQDGNVKLIEKAIQNVKSN
ncbi:MAG: nuclear transport factor 2 family protein [Flavobacteriaceae bacterium]|nr:nuclear transport factor 2 family protein [Flavobacteriaceae bacterium]